MVAAADVLERSIWVFPHDVAGAVEPTGRVRDEALGGQRRSMKITARDAAAADVQLTGGTEWHRR